MMKHVRWILIGMLTALPVLAGIGINSSVRVGDGETRDRGMSAINGKITIGDRATVNGDCHSVNGSITVGEHSRVVGLSSVNGSVEVGREAVVEQSVTSVNGRVALSTGSSAESVGTVNGRIELNAAEVAEDLETVNGNIALRNASRVGGDIVIKDHGGSPHQRRRPLKVELDGGSVVEGSILVERPELKVEVYLREGSRVLGRIENAELIEH